MRIILHEYNRALTDLSNTAGMYNVLESLASTPDNTISKQLAQAIGQVGRLREFEYSGIIISLYGAFERLMESLLRGAIDLHLANTQNYASLPHAIRSAYQVRACESIGLLKDANDFDSVEKLTAIVSSLNSCLNNETPYKLLLEPMLVHTSNFWKKTINKFFQPISLTYHNSSEISIIAERDIRLQRAVANHNGLKTEEVSKRSLFTLLDDLVERRNRVAHGQREDNRLNRDEISRYIEYMRIVGQVLYDSVACPTQSKLLGTHLGTPYRVLRDGAVACVEVNIPIRVGQSAVVCRGDNTWFGATITTIQVDKGSTSSLDPKGPVRAGIGVDIPLMTDSCVIYTL